MAPAIIVVNARGVASASGVVDLAVFVVAWIKGEKSRMPRRNWRVWWVRVGQSARYLLCFLLARRAAPVMPITRRGVGAVGERRKEVIVKRSL